MRTTCGTLARLQIVKVGGSLLQRPDLGPRLRRWLDTQGETAVVLLAGGGELADWVRRADRCHGLGEEAAHWVAVRTMSVTAELLGRLLPAARRVGDWSQMSDLLSGRRPGDRWILDPLDFLQAHEPRLPGLKLGASWAVTSDSVAARLATVSGADELVLLKSADAPATDVPTLRAMGYVDDAFPRLAAETSAVRFVNLAADV